MSTYSAPKWVQNTSSSTAKTTQTRPTRGNFGLALALFAAGSGHPGWAMVAAAVLLGSLGVGVGFVATVVRYDHRHHNRTPRLF